MDYFDLSNGHGSLASGLCRTARASSYLVVSFTSDWLYPTYHSKELVSALTAVGADVTLLQSAIHLGARCLPAGSGDDDAVDLGLSGPGRDATRHPSAGSADAGSRSNVGPGHALTRMSYNHERHEWHCLRADLLAIAELIQPGEKVLDLGCGDGTLLRHLMDTRQITGRGVELSEPGVLACVRKGMSVRQGDLHEGLGDYPDSRSTPSS